MGKKEAKEKATNRKEHAYAKNQTEPHAVCVPEVSCAHGLFIRRSLVTGLWSSLRGHPVAGGGSDRSIALWLEWALGTDQGAPTCRAGERKGSSHVCFHLYT